MEGLADDAPGPGARYEVSESVSLAFIHSLQLLAPRQRAALILRDVLGFPAREAAAILGTTEESVTSALKRARAALERRQRRPAEREPPPAPGSAAERDLAGWLTGHSPPPTSTASLLCSPTTSGSSCRRCRWNTRANGQPAFGFYVRDPHAGVSFTIGLIVLTLSGTRVCAMTRFDEGVLPRFGLPATPPG